jgi:hypothetical protein
MSMHPTARLLLVFLAPALLALAAPSTLAAQDDLPADTEIVAGASSTEMRLNDGRFLVTATYHLPTGQSRPAQAVQLENSFGYFWFFTPDNAEVFVKVLDACAFDEYWMFASGLTNVEVHLKVKDLAAGVEKTYDNPLNRYFPPIFDTDAFDTCDVPDPLPYCIDSTGIAPGTVLGEPAGNSPGQVVFDEEGVKVRVENFYFLNGSTFFGGIEFQSLLGDPADIAPYFSNLAVELDFTGLPFLPRRVTMDFRDDGGFENLSINRQPSPPYAGELTAAPCPLGGVTCSFGPPSAAHWTGTATFTGEISYLRFGGQEFQVDNVCAWPN